MRQNPVVGTGNKKEKKMIINLTPHAVVIAGNTYAPAKIPARVSVKNETAGEIDGVPLVRGQRGAVAGLPDTVPGTIYIVSALVRTSIPTRCDLGSPAGLVRDDAGRVVGANALEIN